MDITMIGLQNAGKTSLLRVLAVSSYPFGKLSCNIADVPSDGSVLADPLQGGEFTIEYVNLHSQVAQAGGDPFHQCFHRLPLHDLEFRIEWPMR